MKHFRTFVIAVAVIGMPLSIYAQTNTSYKTALVDQIIETLALSPKITQSPADFSKRFERNPFGLQEKTNQKWLNAYNKAYEKEQLMHDYRNILKHKLSQLSVDELSTWVNQPSTQKLSQARQDHYSLQGKRKQIIALYELEQDPSSKERQELIATYAKAITPKNAISESSVTIFRSIIKTIDQVSSKLNFTETQISMIVDNLRKQGPKRMKQLKEKGLPVKFYSVPENTIKQSLNFWQSKTGQALAKAIYESMQQAYKKAGQRLSEAVNDSNKSSTN